MDVHPRPWVWVTRRGAQPLTRFLTKSCAEPSALPSVRSAFPPPSPAVSSVSGSQSSWFGFLCLVLCSACWSKWTFWLLWLFPMCLERFQVLEHNCKCFGLSPLGATPGATRDIVNLHPQNLSLVPSHVGGVALAAVPRFRGEGG